MSSICDEMFSRNMELLHNYNLSKMLEKEVF